MPTRKQKRRRAKENRHEYVWEDAEGNELDPSEVPTQKSQPPTSSRSSRPRRGPQAPSWSRTLKRSLIFAPVMLVTVMLLGKGMTLAQQLIQTAIILAIFIPFSYLLDGFFWRSQKRREARRTQAGGKRGS
jgi:ferric-dicitrate binding protein FerR (iron transport regulator)